MRDYFFPKLTAVEALAPYRLRTTWSTGEVLEVDVGDILRKIILSRFANTFALLYASGIPILDSIRTTQDVVGNLVIRRGLERVEQLIVEGQNVTAAFHSIGFFPPLVIRMLRVGESTEIGRAHV